MYTDLTNHDLQKIIMNPGTDHNTDIPKKCLIRQLLEQTYSHTLLCQWHTGVFRLSYRKQYIAFI